MKNLEKLLNGQERVEFRLSMSKLVALSWYFDTKEFFENEFTKEETYEQYVENHDVIVIVDADGSTYFHVVRFDEDVHPDWEAWDTGDDEATIADLIQLQEEGNL